MGRCQMWTSFCYHYKIFKSELVLANTKKCCFKIRRDVLNGYLHYNFNWRKPVSSTTSGFVLKHNINVRLSCHCLDACCQLCSSQLSFNSLSYNMQGVQNNATAYKFHSQKLLILMFFYLNAYM